MKRQSKWIMTSAGGLVAACTALAIGYPMLARQDAQPTTPPPAPAPAQPSSTPPAPAPAPAPATPPAGEKPAGEKPAEPGAQPTPEKPADKPAEAPADKPADKPANGETPAPAAGADAGAKPKDVTPAPKREMPKRSPNGRIIQPDETTVLAFKNVTVDQVLPFIVETTGKVVVPRPDLLPRKITVINDQPIKRSQALNLVFYALQQEGIGVIETQDVINLRNIAEIVVSDVPVIPPTERMQGREDTGTIVLKIFSPKYASARNIVEGFEEAKTMPDFAKIFLDPESNQFSVMGHIGLLQRVEAELDSLDRQSSETTHTRTFRLKYADAEKIATNVKDLFSASTQTQGNQNNQNQWRGWGGQEQNANRGRRRNNDDAATTSANLRVTANTQQNSVTVLAERHVLDQIEDAIAEEWDLPLDDKTVIPKVVQIVNTDAVKMKASLEEIFGKGGAGTSTTPTTGGGGGGQGGQRNNQSSGDSGASQGASRLAGQFAFTALTDSNRLVVIAKSPDNMDFVEKLIKDLDQPKNTGLPKIVELKHASAEELAEQINAMLAQEGTLASIKRQASGLSEDDSNASPFSTSNTDTGTTNTGNTNTSTASTDIQFWWQRARPPTDNAGASNIVSKVRIVPVWRQNALMIMSPPEYTAALLDLVGQLDKPGRQVLISAIVVEISLDDSTALGLRWSSSNLVSTNPDNSVSIGNSVTGTKNNLINSLFDTSVLQTNANLNLILQALALKTTTNILSEPRIFTSDNQEAKFFDGQDIPFVNELQNNNDGNPTQSFDYRAVGIQLTVRPRITVKRDVDLNINLELSSVAPSQTVQSALIVDRRETTTHLIVKDGQTVVLSGIMRNETSNITRKVPLLGDLPLIGALFTSIETRKVNTELIAFITPIVVENTDDADKLYERDRNRLEDMRKKDFGAEDAPPLPDSLKEIKDEGGEKQAPSILPDAQNPPKSETPGESGASDGSSAMAPGPLSYADIVTMSADAADREATRRRVASGAPGLDAATKQRLLDESDKCRERVQIARSQASQRVPEPISADIIRALDVEGAMKEWKARSEASKRQDLDPSVKSRLTTEAEKCRQRMIAASG